MGFHPSYCRYIEETLWERGYVRRQWRRGIAGTRVWSREDTCIVVISTIEVPHPQTVPLDASVEDYFQGLKNVLAGLMRRAVLTDLFLPGGGNLPLPDWFIDWCHANGIRLHLLDAESPLPEWLEFYPP